jgi:hypothetical protein
VAQYQQRGAPGLHVGLTDQVDDALQGRIHTA